jgi:LysR family hydrogen peroxide-inducible transcriptional activator
MNLRDLQYVLAVAEHGHFGRAAAACNVTQPTLSAQILKLEEELGVQLFERDGRRIRVTTGGAEIIEKARCTIAAAADLMASARALRDPFDGPIRLGVINTIGPYLTPYFLQAAARELPRAPIRLVEDLTANLLPMVAEGELDAAIVATDPPFPRIQAIPLYDEPFWLVVRTDHHLAGRKRVAIGELDVKALLLLTDGHCLRDQTIEVCGHPDIGGRLSADIRAASLETLLQLTAAGYGVTLAPGLAVDAWRSNMNVSVIPIKEANARRRVRLIFRRDAPRRKAVEALAQCVRTAAPSSVTIEKLRSIE